MSERLDGGGSMQTDLLASVDRIMDALKAVAAGDLTTRLDLMYDDSHPVGALALSVNSMVEALSDARGQSETWLDELRARVELSERQRQAIRELSVPIIQVWEGVLCAPVVGVFDSMRAGEFMSALLDTVVRLKAQYVVIDVTGIQVMDTQASDHLLRVARATTLLGARCSLSGVSPTIAQTIVQMGIELGGLRTYRSMREALRASVIERLERRFRETDKNGAARAIENQGKRGVK